MTLEVLGLVEANALIELTGPQAAHCTNNECREYRKTGRRRFCGELLPGCRAQCRSCGTWVFA